MFYLKQNYIIVNLQNIIQYKAKRVKISTGG